MMRCGLHEKLVASRSAITAARRYLSSSTPVNPIPAPSVPLHKAHPLVQPFDPAHLSTPSWSTHSLLPSSTSSTPSLPPTLLPHLASLSCLHLPPFSISTLTTDIGRIIQWIALIQPVDTAGVDPLTSPLEAMAAAEEKVGGLREGERRADECAQRADAVTDGGYAEAVLRGARFTNRGFFVVPKVVDLQGMEE